MIRTRFFILALFASLAAGCASSRKPFVDGAIESVFDVVFDAASDGIFGSSTENVDDDELRMLERKGIAPGSDEHKSLKAEEERMQDNLDRFHDDGKDQ